MSLLSAENLTAYYYASSGVVKAVDGVSLSLDDDEILGIAGESGCGKSTFANALMMNIHPPLRFVDGKIIVGDRDLTDMKKKEIRSSIWGLVISLIPQSALNALMPTKRTKDLITDVVKYHQKLKNEKIIGMAEKRFEELGLPADVLDMYPHELSGGMRQRVVIATSTLLNPKLLIADEPTSALDVSTQKQVLGMMVDLKRKDIIKSVIFITHDIAILRQIADRTAIMYAGKIIESGTTDNIIDNPLHPYTRGLIRAVITPEAEVKKRGISHIPGRPPDLLNPPAGCRFHPRCDRSIAICKQLEPDLIENEKGHLLACHNPYVHG